MTFFRANSLIITVLFCWSCTKKPSSQLLIPSLPPSAKITQRQLPLKNETDFLHYSDRAYFIINNYFLDVPSPYPGPISKSVVCPEKLRPHFLNKSSTHETKSAARLYAGSRGEYGVCEDAQIRSASLFLLIYCKESKTAYEVKIFLNREDPTDLEQVFSQITCKNP